MSEKGSEVCRAANTPNNGVAWSDVTPGLKEL